MFQLSNTKTALHQQQLAKDMKVETEKQLAIAERSEQLNNAILVLSGITVIFLPLSFLTGFFGKFALLQLKRI